ncbi:MAG TPA: hypothetical protein VHC63_08775 [Acidimicrobiales bacterium]|nr:hypothetical protein [Acidimicrobiales bacterium]
MLHTVAAAQQSGLVRGIGVAAVVAVAALYQWVRSQRGKKRRSHRP